MTDENASATYALTTEFLGEQMALNVTRGDSSEDFSFTEFDSVNDNQRWSVELISDNTFRIYNRALGPGFSLDSVNDGIFESLTMASTADVSGQLWQISTLENGYCRLTNQFLGSEIALDVTSDRPEGQTITMRPVDNVSGQHWRIENVSVVNGPVDGNCPGT